MFASSSTTTTTNATATATATTTVIIRLKLLLDWCSHNGIYIDPNICILHNQKHGIYVRAANRPITPEQSLVVIPKSAVLSTRSCALADHIPHAPCGHDATLSLALALYSEQCAQSLFLYCAPRVLFYGLYRLLSSHSRWAAYLQSLPSEQNWDGIALFWGATSRDPLSSHDPSDGRRTDSSDLDLDGDAVEAKQWLHGTEAHVHLLLPGSPWTPLLNEISRFYSSVAVPLLERAGLLPSEREFRNAYALVSSRAFMVDAYHGLAMVPIADAFNHAQDNSVHLQCDYDVCTSCGSLGECPHDAETLEDMDVLATPAGMEDPENTCEMVVNAVVAPGEEVFNTYGATLKNAELLVRYGFMLEANDNDILTWTIEEIWDAAGAVLADPREYCWDKEADYGAYLEIMRSWQYDAEWADSDLVIVTETDENRNPLYMTADGALSCKLWLAIALATLKRQGTTIEVAHTRQLLTSMTRAQIQLERRQAVGRSEGDGVDNDAYEALDRLIRTIGELCTRRLDRISRIDVRQQGDHSPGVHSAMVGKYIDNLGTAQRRTQLAVTLALGEISIVESCVAGWDELMAIS